MTPTVETAADAEGWSSSGSRESCPGDDLSFLVAIAEAWSSYVPVVRGGR